MKELQVTARPRIHEGRLDEFKEVAAQCMASVREKDTGALRYDWFLNGHESVCGVLETCRESAAVIEHIANLGDTLWALTGVADMDLEIFGEASEEPVAATAEMGAAVHRTFRRM